MEHTHLTSSISTSYITNNFQGQKKRKKPMVLQVHNKRIRHIVLQNGPLVTPVHGSKSRASVRFVVQVYRSMYGLKHSGRIWYQRCKDDMIALGFHNKKIAPYLFIKRYKKQFIIVAIYVDDRMFFGYTTMMNQTIDMLKKPLK
jgi:hypothetical protein